MCEYTTTLSLSLSHTHTHTHIHTCTHAHIVNIQCGGILHRCCRRIVCGPLVSSMWCRSWCLDDLLSWWYFDWLSSWYWGDLHEVCGPLGSSMWWSSWCLDDELSSWPWDDSINWWYLDDSHQIISLKVTEYTKFCVITSHTLGYRLFSSRGLKTINCLVRQ